MSDVARVIYWGMWILLIILLVDGFITAYKNRNKEPLEVRLAHIVMTLGIIGVLIMWSAFVIAIVIKLYLWVL